MDIKTAEIEYQERLKKFEKYIKGGVDLVFNCFTCGRRVYQSDILHGLGCKRCGSRRVCPATDTLTWLGIHYCRFINWIHEKINKRIKSL